jgi:hypothetical protein
MSCEHNAWFKLTERSRQYVGDSLESKYQTIVPSSIHTINLHREILLPDRKTGKEVFLQSLPERVIPNETNIVRIPIG